MMGKNPEAAIEAARKSKAEAKSRNKYKHKDIERAGGKAASSLWFDPAAADVAKGAHLGGVIMYVCST
eukprot:1175847-Prorocentrum_minimum.AAC.4